MGGVRANVSDDRESRVHASRFTIGGFADIVAQLSEETSVRPRRRTQVNYLALYLERLGASSLIVEPCYVDRHYVDEVGYYYARCFGFRSAVCGRIHAFRQSSPDLAEEGVLDGLLEKAVDSSHREILDLLQAAYLGYVVVRPIPSVPIGRTVLVPPADLGPAQFIEVRYSVHLMGFDLCVRSLAFQQQDRAVGACATTAVWCALQGASKGDGSRPPTPPEVTAAATGLGEGRPVPSAGLNLLQLSESMRSLGFPPDLLGVRGRPDTFKRMINCYLRSNIPVVLAISALPGGADGHAVVISGFLTEASEYEVLQFGADTWRLENSGFERFLLHDDRIGPYVVAELWQASSRETRESQLIVAIRSPDGGVETSIVHYALVPLYPKLRTTAAELYKSLSQFVPLVNVAQDLQNPTLEMFFEKSGDYLRTLYASGIDAHRLARFQTLISLSRYVGIARLSSEDGEPLIDTIWDTTDTYRAESYNIENLLGIVSYRTELSPVVRKFWSELRVLCC